MSISDLINVDMESPRRVILTFRTAAAAEQFIEESALGDVAQGAMPGGNGYPDAMKFAQTANVAQGAEAPWEMDWPEYSYDGMGCGLEDRNITDRYEAMKYGWDEALERVGQILERDGPLYAAPPAQTALTDDARDAIRRAALKEAADLCAIVSTDANRRRKTSDNPTYMEGKSDGAEYCETRILRMIDAAPTAAQSASGDTR